MSIQHLQSTSIACSNCTTMQPATSSLASRATRSSETRPCLGEEKFPKISPWIEASQGDIRNQNPMVHWISMARKELHSDDIPNQPYYHHGWKEALQDFISQISWHSNNRAGKFVQVPKHCIHLCHGCSQLLISRIEVRIFCVARTL